MKKILLIALTAIYLLLVGWVNSLDAQLLTVLDDGALTYADTALAMPDTIYMLSGVVESVYFENLSLVDISSGSKRSTIMTVNDSAMTLDYSYRETLNDRFVLSNLYKDYCIEVTNNVELSRKKTVLVMGDSRTAGLMDTLKYLGGDSLIFIGTQGVNLKLHEGHPGWKYSDFESDPTSPMVFSGNFDFPQYMSSNGFSSVDFVVIRLGTNDVFNQTEATIGERIVTVLASADTIINSMVTYNPNIQIGLVLETPPSEESLFYSTYGISRDRYNRMIHILRDTLMQKYGSDGYAKDSNVSLLPLYTNSDIDNDFSNGVHENVSGYAKEDKTIYAWIKHRAEPEVLSNVYIASNLDDWLDQYTPLTKEYISSYSGESGLVHVIADAGGAGIRQNNLAFDIGTYNLRARVYFVRGSDIRFRCYDASNGNALYEAHNGSGWLEINDEFEITSAVTNGNFYITNTTGDTSEYYVDFASIKKGAAIRSNVETIYLSDFSSSTNGWTGYSGTATGNIDGVAGVDDVLRYYADTVDNNIHFAYTTWSCTLGDTNVVEFDYYLPSGQSNVTEVYIYIGGNGYSPISGQQSYTTTDSWQHASVTWVDANSGGILRIYARPIGGASYAGADSPSDDVIYIKNVVHTLRHVQ